MNRRISVIASCSVQYPCCVLCLFALIAMFYVLRCMYVCMYVCKYACLLTMYLSGFVFCFLRGEDGWTRGIGRPSKNRWTFRVLVGRRVVLQSELKIRVHSFIHSFIQSINLFISYERTKNKSSSYTMIMIQVSIPNQARQENQRPTNRFEDGTARLENQRTTR